MGMKRRAFTLVEIMVTLAVFSALVMVLHSFMRFSTATQGRLSRRGTALDEAHRGLLVLIEHLQRSPYVETPGFGDMSKQIVFQDRQRKTWVVAAEDGDLVMKEKFGTGRRRIVQGLKKLQVYREHRDLLYLEMSVAVGREGFSLTTAVYLRRCHAEPVAAFLTGGS